MGATLQSTLAGVDDDDVKNNNNNNIKKDDREFVRDSVLTVKVIDNNERTFSSTKEEE